MIFVTFAFYLFAFVTIASGIMVISAKNPVHSVMWLILAFFSAAGLFVLMGAEFLAMLLVIVYVGAVAVLFLFVVMMLDINFVEMRQGFLQYLHQGLLVGLILLVEIVTLVSTWPYGTTVVENIASPMPEAVDVNNTVALGQILYTDYIYPFQVAGLILLVAMIGAIVLTFRRRPGIKRQNIMVQNARRPEDSFEVVDVKSGEGI
jgi:NADH-quinone oxidoreductase subunit J